MIVSCFKYFITFLQLQFSEVLMKARELFKTLAGPNKNALHEQKFDFSRFQVLNTLLTVDFVHLDFIKEE